MSNAGTIPSQERPLRILVVDDEKSVREIQEKFLNTAGYHVATAEDGAVGWAMLQKDTYDLLITDQEMPNLSGIDLIKKVQDSHLRLQVIMATSTPPSDVLVASHGINLAALLMKPYTGSKFLETVSAVLMQPPES